MFLLMSSGFFDFLTILILKQEKRLKDRKTEAKVDGIVFRCAPG